MHPKISMLMITYIHLGMAGNFFSTLAECTGEYLAMRHIGVFQISQLDY